MTASLEDQLEALAAEPPEIDMILKADVGHILAHTAIDEPSGTWTGSACPRHQRPLGSDVDLADLGVMSRTADGLADACWYAPPTLAEVYRMTVNGMMADGEPSARKHTLDWWQHRVNVAWSYAWKANYTFLTEVVEAPARASGGDGLLIASFEHNSSEHGLARPHVHNLMVRRREPGPAEQALAESYRKHADELDAMEKLRRGQGGA
jgi:hypothetical protein